MPENADYDAASLYIDPTALAGSAKNLVAHATDVAEAISAISETLSGLGLSWAGTTQDEVDKMNNGWTSTMRSLFGTQDEPEAGVLNVMAAGALAVAAGNAQTEVELFRMFMKFYAAIGESGGGGSLDSPPADRNDPENSAVTADW